MCVAAFFGEDFSAFVGLRVAAFFGEVDNIVVMVVADDLVALVLVVKGALLAKEVVIALCSCHPFAKIFMALVLLGAMFH